MGATGIVGDQAQTVAFLAAIVGPGGHRVVRATGSGSREPPADGLAAFGMTRDELADGVDGFAGARPRGRARAVVAVELVATGEWDDYEAAVRGRPSRPGPPRTPTIPSGTPSSPAQPVDARVATRAGAARRWASRSAAIAPVPADARADRSRRRSPRR